MDPFELLQKVVFELESKEIPYLITGSVAAMAYGEPRMTNDIDIVVELSPNHISHLIGTFNEEYYIDEDMILQALKNKSQFNIIHLASGLKIDFIIKTDSDFNISRFQRAKRLKPTKKYSANFASPEDVIIKKMEYYTLGESDKHIRDIIGILKISGDSIDRNYIDHWCQKQNMTELWHDILSKAD